MPFFPKVFRQCLEYLYDHHTINRSEYQLWQFKYVKFKVAITYNKKILFV